MDIVTLKKAKKHIKRAAIDTMLTFFLIGLATVISSFIAESLIDPMQVLMIYVLMVLLVASVTSGHLFGMIAALAAVMGVNFFFTYPYSAFNFSIAGYPITFGTLLVVSLTTSLLASRVKIQRRQALDKEHQNEVLYELANSLFHLRNLEEIARAGVESLSKLFEGGAIIYVGDPNNNNMLLEGDAPQQGDEKAIKACYKNNTETGRGTLQPLDAKGCYLPISGGLEIFGVAGITYGLSESEIPRRLVFLRLVVHQIAAALEHRELEQRQQEAAVAAKTESMRGNLLRAISHDLRTPLTGIYGAASTLMEQQSLLEPQEKAKMLSDICENASWMIRMVENLLTVTRIENNNLPIQKTPEAAEEIIGAAMVKLRKSFPEASVCAKSPEELLIVPMDGILVQQVLINLIENAVKYSFSKKPIEVSVSKRDNSAYFTVSDDGVGLSSEHIPVAFSGLASGKKESADARRGIGIGLPICKTIINAHGGSIGVYNREEGGCCFYFSLPIEESEEES